MKEFRKFAIFLLVAVFIFTVFVPAGVSHAEANDPDVEVVRYFKVDNPPIPVGAVIEVIDYQGKTAFFWKEPLGTGFFERVFILEGVEINYWVSSPTSASSYPELGEKVFVVGYGDWNDSKGEYNHDGITDVIFIEKSRSWTKTQADIIRFGNEFYNEAVTKNFIYIHYGPDCPPTEFRINGVALKPGPYGNTFYVPANGGMLEAYYKPGQCSWSSFTGVRWSVKVNPGDTATGIETIFVRSLKDQDPENFCAKLDWMRPVWQPESLAYDKQLEYECPSLWSKNSDEILATLSREGFMRADNRYGDDQIKDITPFVWWGHDEKILSWPKHKWIPMSKIILSSGAEFTVEIGKDSDTSQDAPIIDLVGGQPSTTPYNSDIPWYNGWGTPIVFVPDEKIEYQATMYWEDLEVFRIMKVGGKAVVEKAEWIK